MPVKAWLMVFLCEAPKGFVPTGWHDFKTGEFYKYGPLARRLARFVSYMREK